MQHGDHFTVRDGCIRIPAGGYVCLWSLQSLLPLITPKEREIAESRDEDWMWRVHHAQCPDPEGRVIYQIERLRKLGCDVETPQGPPAAVDAQGSADTGGPICDLRVVVETVKGRCTSGMRPGDYFVLRSGRLYIPADRHLCLYALQAVLPFLAAKQRRLEDGDWLKDADLVICPDPAGNVIMRMARCP
jgi:uncharacterized repeat protein (TIGR04076 family)